MTEAEQFHHEAVMAHYAANRLHRDSSEDEMPDDDPFENVLREMSGLHILKGQDYGTNVDPYANVRASEECGIPAWKGAILRANDKMSRLKTYCRTGSLANEGVEDSLIDLANYAVIALVLFRECHAGKTQTE